MFNAYKTSMFLRALLALSLVSMPAQIWAMPIANLGCDSSSYQRGMSDLVHKVRRIGAEDRKDVEVLATERGWSPAKKDFVRKSTGRIFCDDGVMLPDPQNPSRKVQASDSAFLIGTNHTLATAAHVFLKPDGSPRIPMEKWNTCKFVNYDGVESKLVFDSKGTTFQFGDFANSKNRNLKDDWLIVRLQNGIPGTSGFRVDRDGVRLTSARPDNEDIVNFSKAQQGSGVESNALSGQYCDKDKYKYVASENRFVSACDSAPGISGSVVASERGESFVALGIVQGGVNARPEKGLNDGDPFNENSNYTAGSVIDHRVISAIERIKKPGPPIVTADVSL